MIKRTISWIVVFAIAAGAIWIYSRHVLASNLALADEWAAIQQTKAVLQNGSKTSDWPLRGFVPASTLQSAAAAIKGAEIEIPIGKAIDDHVDGFVNVTVQSANIIAEDASLRVRLSASARYISDRTTPWWANATARINVDALLMPDSQLEQNGILINNFRIVPDSVSLAPGFENFDIRIIWGFGKLLAADELLLRLKAALLLPIPAITPAFELDASVNSTSFQPFGGVEVENSGTNITIAMKRAPEKPKITFDQWLLTRSGVWLLGGKKVTPGAAGSLPSPSVVLEEMEKLKGTLAAFQKTDSLVELTIPAEALTDFIDAVMKPPMSLSVTTGQTKGNITDAIAIHNDKVLGNVGLEVRPKGDNFASGSVTLNPGKASWSTQSGLAIPLSLKASADVTLDIHLATGIGGGIGNTIGLKSGADVPKLLVQASFEQTKISLGEAILLRPTIPCTPMALQVYPGAAPAISENWIIVSPVGFELDREIGGMKISPAVLVDGLPIISGLPTALGADGKPLPPDPHKTTLRFQSPFLSTVLAPAGVSLDDAGVTVRATAKLSTRGEAETEAEKNTRNNLRQALKDASPETECKNMTGLKLVGGQATFVDLYKEFVYIGQALKNQEKVGAAVLNTLTDLDPKNTPENLKKLADAVGTAVTYDAKHLWDTVTNPPTASASVGGVTVTAGPTGATVSGTVGGTRVEVHPAGVSVGGVCVGWC